MALRALMKNKELKEARKQLEELRAKQAGFETREEELEQAVEEAETEEEKKTVEEAIDEFEAEKEETAKEIEAAEERVSELESEIEELEAAQRSAAPKVKKDDQKKMEVRTMSKRNLFASMDAQRRAEIFENEQVRTFLGTVREAIREKRAITNAGLLIPEVFLGMIRENIEGYSKLVKYVNLRPVSGDAREVVMGTVPEAVWTDMCGTLNELSLTFNDVEVACWKVAGYFDVCNAVLEDNDVDLASELMTSLGQAVGYALDKAILYGTGTRMPLGIVTRLAQTAAPSDYPATARTWVDLHSTNITKTNKTGVNLFQEILTASAASKGKYSKGQRVWAMNETTYKYLQAQGLSINAAGVIVSGMENTMPVVGGKVELLEFIPDYDIITGYGDLYLLAERAGITLKQSEHVHFIQDKTVFAGVARYDGQPVIAEGFMAMNVNNVAVTTTMTFAADSANATASTEGE